MLGLLDPLAEKPFPRKGRGVARTAGTVWVDRSQAEPAPHRANAATVPGLRHRCRGGVAHHHKWAAVQV